MDINLSGQIDGIVAAEKIHQKAPNAVIIYITAASREKTSIIEDKELLLRKPINPNILRETIKRVSEKKVRTKKGIKGTPTGPKKILMVEDSKLTAKIQKRILERLGHVVLEIVETGEEAVEKAAALRPEIVLSDIDLAGEMDGIQAAHQIYDRFKIPIVYVSGRKDAENEPFVRVNKQAFTADDLQTAIEEAIKRG
jgi:CheY-like chemotaxis protein